MVIGLNHSRSVSNGAGRSSFLLAASVMDYSVENSSQMRPSTHVYRMIMISSVMIAPFGNGKEVNVNSKDT